MTDASPYDIEIVQIFASPPDRIFKAFTDPDLFARWYGPDGFPVARETVELDPREGGPHRFTMVSDADPSFRTAFEGRFTEVLPNQLLVSTGAWGGIPGQSGSWESNLRVELTEDGDNTHVVIREGPHPPGTAEMGRQSWAQMLPKLESLLAA